jgi:plastocyanin
MALFLAPVSQAGYPTIEAQANGNIFTGGLSFTPAKINGQVGQLVRWTNTDFIAPHTVTEDHGLFDLVGTNTNGTPVSKPGFDGSVDLLLMAGTITYYCVVHPTQMHGTLSVPVTLTLGPRPRHRSPQRTVTLLWAVEPPSAGEVYDVERRVGNGAWTPIATGTTKISTRIMAGTPGTVTTVRARLRSAADAKRTTGWSPEASVTA